MENLEDIYELSPMQQGMLFHTLYTPASEIYFEQLQCILSGQFNYSAFQKAWDKVINRHSVLRSSFYWEEIEKPLQMVSKQVEIPWKQLNWQHLTTDEQQQKLEEFLVSDRQEGFALEQAPLMRFTVIKLTEKTYQFIWSHHHILFDGWSMQIILKEVLDVYTAIQNQRNLQLSPAPVYREYIEWLQQQDIPTAKQFWRQKLQEFETPNDLGLANNQQQKTEKIYHEQYFQFSSKLTEELQSIARKHHLTLNSLVQGAWSLLISRYSREKDIVFGATVSGRQPVLANIDAMVGLLINTIPMRIKIDDQQALITWLQDIQTQGIEQEQYSYLSLAEIQQESDILPGMSLFTSVVVFENYPVDSNYQNVEKLLELSNLSCFERTNYPLTVVINPGSQLRGRFIYDSGIFEQQTIMRMIGHLQNLLTQMSANLQQNLHQLSLLSLEAEQEIIQLENHQNNENIKYECVHILFEEQVEKTPDRIALVYKEKQLTYRELNNHANQLAHYLKSLGVKPETKVGICVERSLEMVIGILAILKAGGAYIILDPAYPPERLTFMLEDTQTSILITQTSLQKQLKINSKTIINIDQDWTIISQHSQENLPNIVNIENLAYIIYTSGSTGTPKGTEVPHRSLIGFMFGVDYIKLDEKQIWLQHSSTSWDAITLELWPPLLYGGKCVIYPDRIPSPESLINIIQAEKINTLFLTTALFNLIIDTNPQGLLGVKQLVTGGEKISLDHVQRALEILPETQIVNGYGPSECTVFTCCYPIPNQIAENITSIPIGKPIGDRKVYILDDNLQRVTIGIPGELYVGGKSVARGYLNQPKLTREKFISNPFIDGETLYKTGDLVRRLADGNLEFISRIDNQVKIRGIRIEPSEIEAALIQYSQIKQVVVIVREDQPGNKILVAYLVTDNNSIDQQELRNYLKQNLPDYMIPTAFLCLEKLPLTPNGKINHRALPIPNHSQRNLQIEFVAPQTSTEQELANIWSEVLNLKQIGINDNFFEIGGHSLLATQIISRLKETFNIDFYLRYLFEHPTIAELAQKITEQQIQQTENDDLAAILAEVDQLSEEEITQQLSS
ncbi:MAG: amino acid adenylation domain-containing protein [Sphaerospermopsis sp. SIO1G2]|nr:amino acid adenylation domain-containing protein [Sphaerospermopsis sp. SIO1G2]